VLGASILQVMTMISRNYLWLALIAALIAFPVAYYFMKKWLNVFPYNTGLTVLPFVLSAFVILVTATTTSMFYSAKAALTRPSKILKTE
jgi:putative ABC transport system permease protein